MLQTGVCSNELTTKPLFYGHYTGQPALAGTSGQGLADFVGVKFYCLHAHGDGNHGKVEDAGVFLSSVIYTVAIPRSSELTLWIIIV